MSAAQVGLAGHVEQLRRRWPQAHAEPRGDGWYLVHLPGMLLPDGWNKTICTASFLAQGWDNHLLSPLDGFFVDWPDLRLASGGYPTYTRSLAPDESIPGFPQWRELTRFWWKAQMFNPNRDTLFTSAMLIQIRLSMVR